MWLQTTLIVATLAAAGCSRKAGASATPLDAGSTSVASVPALDASVGAAKPFGEGCAGDAECAGGVCFHKRLKQPGAAPERRGVENEAVEHDGYCSLRCRDDADCPVPPTKGKCGARGMCKRQEG